VTRAFDNYLANSTDNWIERHLVRHQEKDEEAGGEGLGDLQTRKKLWRDADGRIVTNRPAQNGENRVARKKQSDTEGQNFPIHDNSYFTHEAHFEINSALLSPPGTSLSNESFDQFSQVSPEQHFVPHDDIFDFMANSTWGTLPPGAIDLQVDTVDAPLDDMFRPDTGSEALVILRLPTVTNYSSASSFNMPFTTLNNYNWLFDSPANLDVDMASKFRSQQTRPNMTSRVQAGLVGTAERHMIVSQVSSPDTFLGLEMLSSNIDTNWSSMPATTSYPEQTMSGTQATTRPVELQPSPTRTNSNHDFAQQQRSYSEMNTDAPISTANDNRAASRPVVTAALAPPQANFHHQDNPPRTSFDPSCTITGHTLQTMPLMDDDSRDRILDLLIDARPTMPAGINIRADNPLLSLSSMQTCLDLFFSRFNVVYPLLHKPTFEPAHTETFLLLAIILLGATYSDKKMHMLAVCIHDTLRAQIFQHPDFTARPELWILQTMLLVECFGKSRAGQKQHDMAHLFHGLLIK
jgi:hypothetical protein